MAHRRALACYAYAAILVTGLAACSPAQQDDPRTQIPLVRAAVVQDVAQPERSYTGVIVARVQSDLGFRVPGKIVERMVDAGQAVKRGQPLMRIDPTDLVLADLAQTQAVAAAQALAIQTAADEKRLRALVSAGAVSASAYDQAKAAADSAKAQLTAAQARANVARNQAGYSTLLSDADGVVVETLGEPGQVVAAGQTTVRVARSGPREAVIDLPETVRPALGSMGQATLYGGVVGPARLRQLSDSANVLTRTFEARYVLEGAAAAAPLGSTVTVRLADVQAHSSVQIPLGAVFDRGQGPGVWLIGKEPAEVSWRGVQLAGLGEETATVTGGLAPGDRFVALGAHLLHQGERVRVAGKQESIQ